MRGVIRHLYAGGKSKAHKQIEIPSFGKTNSKTAEGEKKDRVNIGHT